jgi:hypothetical protein
VIDASDQDHQGKLLVSNSTLFPQGPHWVRGASPVAYAGAGFFHVPEPGSTVLVMGVVEDTAEFIDGEPTKASVEYVWFSCLWDPSVVRAEAYERDASEPKDSGVRSRVSIPEVEKVYEYNDSPEKAIWKTTTGHKVELSEKVTFDKGGNLVQEDHILIENRTGQRILLDQGSGKDFDRIVITDGNNIIRIQRGQDFKIGENAMQIECIGNMFLTSKTGQMYLNVEKDSDSNIIIQNDGKGDVIVDSANGDVDINAGNNMNLTAKNQMTLKASRIDLNP